MKTYWQYLIVALALCLIFTMADSRAYGAWRPKPRTPKKTKIKAAQRKTYNYIKSHDYNHDGKVDARDRLIWVNRNKNNFDTVYVSTENEDIVEIMDLDGDGDVESWELDSFYSQYDTNENGILEDEEIEAAID
jgi:hypothetical protein